MKTVVFWGLLVIVAPVTAENLFTGTDFLQGSASVDAARYLQGFLEAQDAKIPTKLTSRSFGFSVISRWTPAAFLVRDTDTTGLPLLGPSAGGLVRGGLMTYQAALLWRADENLAFYLSADYFLASHIDNFFSLFDPWYSSNDVLSFFSYLFTFGLYGPLTGGRATGFASMAGQFLPGVEYQIPGWAKFRLGAIFKFRDAINPDGRFISTYFVEKNGWTGITGKQKGDYLDRSRIPAGVGGFETSELYFSAQVFGLDALSLFSPSGAVKAVTAGPDLLGLSKDGEWPSPWRELAQLIKPYAGFLEQGYSAFRPDASWIGLLKGDLTVEGLSVHYQTDLTLEPLKLNQFKAEAAVFGLLGGLSGQAQPDGGFLWGTKIGFGGGFEALAYEMSWSWNYAGSEIGGLKIHDDVVFTFQFRF